MHGLKLHCTESLQVAHIVRKQNCCICTLADGKSSTGSHTDSLARLALRRPGQSWGCADMSKVKGKREFSMSSWIHLNWSDCVKFACSVFWEKKYVLKPGLNNKHVKFCWILSLERTLPVSCILTQAWTTDAYHPFIWNRLFCLIHPYRCLFKNRGRWLEFNVRVIAWSIALIFAFEWSGCIAELPSL